MHCKIVLAAGLACFSTCSTLQCINRCMPSMRV